MVKYHVEMKQGTPLDFIADKAPSPKEWNDLLNAIEEGKGVLNDGGKVLIPINNIAYITVSKEDS